ncbi:hypothetical protein LX36DRAFT_223312 [Colletotrichum falcatum]|nr:hypothetical protein LX36DRAFT_223312 [Colletotrichum falcatum]
MSLNGSKGIVMGEKGEGGSFPKQSMLSTGAPYSGEGGRNSRRHDLELLRVIARRRPTVQSYPSWPDGPTSTRKPCSLPRRLPCPKPAFSLRCKVQSTLGRAVPTGGTNGSPAGGQGDTSPGPLRIGQDGSLVLCIAPPPPPPGGGGLLLCDSCRRAGDRSPAVSRLPCLGRGETSRPSHHTRKRARSP